MLAWLTLLFVSLNNYSIGQTEYIKEYDLLSHSLFGTEAHFQKRINKTSEGYILVSDKGAESSTELMTLDHNGELSGVSKIYTHLSRTTSVIPIEEETGLNGYLLYGDNIQEGEAHTYIIRTSNDGGVLWSKKVRFQDNYGIFRAGLRSQAIQVEDGNVILAMESSYLADPGTPALDIIKINPNTGAVLYTHQMVMEDLNKGFRVNGIIEGEPGNYYVYGGHTTETPKFILHFSDGGGASFNIESLKFFSIPNATVFSSMDYNGEKLLVGGGITTGGYTKVLVFEISTDLNTISSLEGIINQCNTYDVGDWENLSAVKYFAGRIIVSGITNSGGITDRNFVITLSSSGTIINTSASLVGDFEHRGHNLFIQDDSFVRADYRGSWTPGESDHISRLTSYSPLGNTCADESISVSSLEWPANTYTQPIILTIPNIQYENFYPSATPVSFTRNVICSDCITPEEVGPITTSTGDSTLCELESLDLIAPPGFEAYEWFFEGDAFGSGNLITATEGGEYSVILIDSIGCEIELFITIAPPVDLSDWDNSVLCLGSSYILPSFTEGDTWTGPEVSFSLDGSMHSFTPLTAGIYTLTYCNTYGCCIDITITVGGPTVSIDGDLDLCVSNPITLGALIGIYPEPVSVIWSPSGETTTSITVTEPGIYTVTATGTESGCSSTSSVEVFGDDQWHKTTENTTGEESGNDVVTDDEGNLYVVGTFTNTTELQGGANPNITIDAGGLNPGDMYLAKYDRCGTLIWVANSTGVTNCTGSSLTVDEVNDMVYVTGTCGQGTTFHSAQSADDLCLAGTSVTIFPSLAQTGYVAQYDKNTGCLYFAEEVAIGESVDCRTIAVNETNGEIFLGGSFSISSDYYAFLYKYQPTTGLGIGNMLNPTVWQIRDNVNVPETYSVINDVDFDESQNRIYAIGSFTSVVNLFNGVLTSTTTIGLESDVFLATYDDLGGGTSYFNLRSGNRSPNGLMTGEGVAVDEATHGVYLTGSYSAPVITPAFFFPGIDPLMSFNDNLKSYMVKLNFTSPSDAWGRHTVTSAIPNRFTHGNSVATDGVNAYFLNDFSDDYLTVAPGGGFSLSRTFIGNPINSAHIGIICYTADGNRKWVNVTESQSATDSDDHRGTAICSDNNGNSFITGHYENAMSYYSGIPYSGNLIQSGAGHNAHILRINNTSGELKINQNDLSELEESLVQDELSMLIFPNPSNGLVNIAVNDFDLNENYQGVICNSMGEELMKFSLSTSRSSIDMSAFANGIYFLTVSTGQDLRRVSIVKQ